jgi:hypothetical protein
MGARGDLETQRRELSECGKYSDDLASRRMRPVWFQDR